MSKLLSGLVVVLGIMLVWLVWDQYSNSFELANLSKVAVAAENNQVLEVKSAEKSSTQLVDEKGNLLYLTSAWQSIEASPKDSIATVKVPANTVVWGDKLVFTDCKGQKQDLTVAITSLPCEVEMQVTWGAYALDPVSVSQAKTFLDAKYQSKSGFPITGFKVFSP